MAPTGTREPLNRTERMWVSAQVNGPGWGIFYGIGAMLLIGTLGVSVLGADLSAPLRLIALLLCVLMLVPALYVVVRSLSRVLPWQRLRRAGDPQAVVPVKVAGANSDGDLAIRFPDGQRAQLRGPGVHPRDAERMRGLGEPRLAIYGPRRSGAPARLAFQDGTYVIGQLMDDSPPD